MDEVIQFNQLTTSLKSMESINSDQRYFEGLLTVQMKDKQGEVTIVDELYKVLPVWMDRGAPISDTHSNRIIGKGINYSKTVVKNEHGEDLPAIKITGKIYKNYELDNVIWNKIKNKEYKGLSFGGATRANRTPMRMKDGSTAYALSSLEHYEVAVCKDPAVPMAIITDYNPIAKANYSSTMRDDDKMVIQCTNMGCYIEKTDLNESQQSINKDSLEKIENKLKNDLYDYIDKDDVNKVFPLIGAAIGAAGTAARGIIGSAAGTAARGALGSAAGTSARGALGTAAGGAGKVGSSALRGIASPKGGVGGVPVGTDTEDDDDDTMKSAYQTEAGNDQLGGQGKTEDDKDKREKEDEDKKNDEVKHRDHSDSDGDMTSMFNQNVGKGDTTVNQVGGVRGGNDTAVQGSGETNDINEVKEDEEEKDEEERNEDKGASNIKVVKAIKYSLEKHAQIQQLKKIKGDLIKTQNKFQEQSTQARVGDKKHLKDITHPQGLTIREASTIDHRVGNTAPLERKDTSIKQPRQTGKRGAPKVDPRMRKKNPNSTLPS